MKIENITAFCLYHTSACHLCEDAEVIVNDVFDELADELANNFLDKSEVRYSHVDIADDDELLEAYGILIPVFYHSPSRCELRWPFDAHQVRKFIQEHS